MPKATVNVAESSSATPVAAPGSAPATTYAQPSNVRVAISTSRFANPRMCFAAENLSFAELRRFHDPFHSMERVSCSDDGAW